MTHEIINAIAISLLIIMVAFFTIMMRRVNQVADFRSKLLKRVDKQVGREMAAGDFYTWPTYFDAMRCVDFHDMCNNPFKSCESYYKDTILASYCYDPVDADVIEMVPPPATRSIIVQLRNPGGTIH